MALPIDEGAWSLDPAHSVVEFAVRHLGITTVRGRFGSVTATLDVGSDLASTSLTAEIDMSSVDTGNPDRDGHLRSTDFFDVDNKPKVAFASSSIEDDGDGRYRVTGDLVINDVTKNETFAASFFGTDVFPMDGSTRAGFELNGQVNRNDYGIAFNVDLPSGAVMLSETVDLTVHAQLVAPSAD